MLHKWIRCILCWLFGGRWCENDTKPPQKDPAIRTSRPLRPQVLIKLSGLGPFDSDAQAQAAVFKDPQFRELVASFGMVKVRRAFRVPRKVIEDLRGAALDNAKRYGFDSPDPQLGSYVYVTLPRDARPDQKIEDLYCRLKGWNGGDRIELSNPPNLAMSSDNYRVQTGATAIAQPPLMVTGAGCAVVDIELALPPLALLSAPIVEVPAEVEAGLLEAWLQSSNPVHKSHGAATVGVLAGDALRTVQGMAPGAQVFYCPCMTGSDDDPQYEITSAVAASAYFLRHGAMVNAPLGKVILIPMEAPAGWPIEFLDSATAAGIGEAMDAGVAVVTAAGNGKQHITLNPAIGLVVAAGGSGENGTRFGEPHATTSHGAGVDCWAWGDSIRSLHAATGTSGALAVGVDLAGYQETSGAVSIVAGAAVLMQGVRAKEAGKLPLHPRQIRDLLRAPGHQPSINEGVAHADGRTLVGKFMPQVAALEGRIRAMPN